jgi:hypothetical protein
LRLQFSKQKTAGEILIDIFTENIKQYEWQLLQRIGSLTSAGTASLPVFTFESNRHFRIYDFQVRFNIVLTSSTVFSSAPFASHGFTQILYEFLMFPLILTVTGAGYKLESCKGSAVIQFNDLRIVFVQTLVPQGWQASCPYLFIDKKTKGRAAGHSALCSKGFVLSVPII